MSSSKSFLHSRRYQWINLYPPFLGAGIRVLHKQSDDYTIKVQLKLTRLNLNAVGTHFGGSLYAMCDPFFMLILLEHMGRDYVVWDKAASIQFLKPGRGTVTATFHITPEQIASLPGHITLRKVSDRESHLLVELREGRNRQVRRMFDGIGHEVTSLKRVRFGGLDLGAIQPGGHREILHKEIAKAFPGAPGREV